MNIKRVRETIRSIIVPIGFSAVGFLVAFALKVLLKVELDRLMISAIAFVVTTAGVLFLFPRVFKIPFGRVNAKDFIFRVGLYRPAGIHKYILIGLISALITLSGMMLASMQTGKYVPVLSTITLTQAVFSLTPGIWEEILFRGVLMIVLLRLTKSLKKAAIIQIILFGLAHIKGLDLISLVDTFSVSIIAIAFTYITYKTRSLIPAIVFHYLHDTFLFFVQLPEGQYQGFSDNAIFYSFLWLSVALAVLITKKMSERYRIQGRYNIYFVGTGKEDKDTGSDKPCKNNKELRKSKKILLINAVGFSVLLIFSISEAGILVIIFDFLFVLTNLLLYFFLKRFKKNIRFYIGLLTSFVAFVTAYDYYKQGSKNIYFCWILIGLISFAVALFKKRKARRIS